MDAIVLVEGFIENLGDIITLLALMGSLSILGIEFILHNRWFSSEILPIPNLMLFISIANKLLIFLYVLYCNCL